MDTLISPHFRYDGLNAQKTPKNPSAEPVPARTVGGVKWVLQPDSVHFSGGPNRAQLAARQKNKQRRTEATHKAEKLKDEVYDIENDITELYDQRLNKKDRLAFQKEIITILEKHPDFPIDHKIRPDLAIKRDPGNPLFHFAVGNADWVLASYILTRNPDLCRKDSRGNSVAKVLGEVMAERNGEPPESEGRLAMEAFVDQFRRYRVEYAEAHPDKVNEIYQDDIDNASGRIVLKGFAETDLETFVQESGPAVPDDKNTEPKIVSQKQKQAVKRQKQAQKQKDKRAAEAEQKAQEQNEKLEALSLTAKRQAEVLAQREIEEKELRKTEELNRRLDAMPEMTISEEWLKLRSDEPQAEWQTVTHPSRTTSSSKSTGTSSESVSSKPGKQPFNKANGKIHRKRQPKTHSQALGGHSLPTAIPDTKLKTCKPGNPLSSSRSPKDAPVPSGSPWKLPERPMAMFTPTSTESSFSQAVAWDSAVTHSPGRKMSHEEVSASQLPAVPEYCLSPQPLSPHDSVGTTVEEFLLDDDKSAEGQSAKVNLPDPAQYSGAGSSKGSILSNIASHATNWQGLRKSTGQTSISLASSNQSWTAKIANLKKERDEKQQLLNEASAFYSRERQVTDEMRQRLQQATTALMEKSSELEQAQNLHLQKEAKLGQDASYWRNQAEQNAWMLQMQTEERNRYVDQHEALNSLRGAFNILRQRVANLQEERKLEHSKKQQNKDLQTERLKQEETAIEDLEKLQGQIKQREVEAKTASTWAGFKLSTNPDDYFPCSSGLGYRLKEGCPGQGSWVYEIPKG